MSNTEVFIISVHERPILWDKRNKNYHNRLSSQREWEKVAKIIKITVDAAKKKWKNLRDTFVKELKKIPKPRSGAGAENEPKYTGSWPYFDMMSFLKVVQKPRETHGNIPVEDDENLTECESINHTQVVEYDTPLSISILEGIESNFYFIQPPSPSASTPTPSAPAPTPSALTPTPSAPAPTPSALTPTPSAPAPMSSALTPTPSAPAPTPSAPTPTPSAPAPTPSAPTPTPSAPAPTPSAPTPTPSAPAPTKKGTKRRRKENDLEAFISIEKEKLKLLEEDKQDSKDDDMMWFKSILPYMKKLPGINKLHFRTRIQEHLLNELAKLDPQSNHQEFNTSL